ncbi:MAG: hypothetical protein K2Q01_04100, partial [Rickettsiales bacterium]|nr:hypothetical protein [Rickettsiales bacterium]
VIGKLIGVLMAGRSLSASTPLVNRLLTGIAVIVGLAILSAILAGVLVVGMLYGAYAILVAHGLEQDMALIVVGALTLGLIAMLVRQLVLNIQEIKAIPTQIIGKQNRMAERASKVGAAFLDGLLSPPAASSSVKH